MHAVQHTHYHITPETPERASDITNDLAPHRMGGFKFGSSASPPLPLLFLVAAATVGRCLVAACGLMGSNIDPPVARAKVVPPGKVVWVGPGRRGGGAGLFGPGSGWASYVYWVFTWLALLVARGNANCILLHKYKVRNHFLDTCR